MITIEINIIFLILVTFGFGISIGILIGLYLGLLRAIGKTLDYFKLQLARTVIMLSDWSKNKHLPEGFWKFLVKHGKSMFDEMWDTYKKNSK